MKSNWPERWQVYHNGQPVSEVFHEDYDCLVWLMQNQPLNIDAAERAGYEVRQLS